VQTAPAGWPGWLRDINAAAGLTPLEVGSRFEWQTQGLSIISTVTEVDPGVRIVWEGPAEGILAVHTWALTVMDAAVIVRTEESCAGPTVEANVPATQAALDAFFRGWLEDLKKGAERRIIGDPH